MARPKTDVKLDIKIENRALLAKLTRMSKVTGRARATVIRSAMNLFTQSVVKATPPLRKAKDCSSWGMRKVVPIDMDTCRNFQAFVSNPKNRVKNPSAFWDYLQHTWEDNHPWKMKYRVTIKGSKKKRTLLFPAKSHARPFVPIYHRNIGKQSWISAMEIAGVPTTAKRPPGYSYMFVQAKALAGGRGPKENASLVMFCYLQSRVTNIGRYAIYAVAQALRATNNRISHALKAAEKKVAQA